MKYLKLFLPLVIGNIILVIVSFSITDVTIVKWAFCVNIIGLEVTTVFLTRFFAKFHKTQPGATSWSILTSVFLLIFWSVVSISSFVCSNINWVTPLPGAICLDGEGNIPVVFYLAIINILFAISYFAFWSRHSKEEVSSQQGSFNSISYSFILIFLFVVGNIVLGHFSALNRQKIVACTSDPICSHGYFLYPPVFPYPEFVVPIPEPTALVEGQHITLVSCESLHSEQKYSCIYQFARIKKDVSLCDKLTPDSSKYGCYFDVTLTVNDISICGKIPEQLQFSSNGQLIREACYTSMAFANKDKSMCDFLKTQLYKTSCLRGVDKLINKANTSDRQF